MGEESEELRRVRASVERFVRSRAGASEDGDLEDVVQEALARLLENRDRLEPAAWEAYAVVSARNLLLDGERAGRVHRRHWHRLHAPDVSDSAEERLLTLEEHEAVRRALTTLPAQDRAVLAERYGTDDVPTRTVAPAAAARLARARGKLRVAYLLEHTGLALPTDRCRPVLEALSSGDSRRQERLGTARHLVSCRVCATYAPVLARRDRALAALHPLAWAAVLSGAGWSAVRRHPGRTATATTAAVLASVLAVSVWPARAPEPRSPLPRLAAEDERRSGSLVLAATGRPLLPRDEVPPPTGDVEGVRVTVQDVPADEAFWVGSGAGQRFLVELVGAGESPVQLRVGDTVSFRGRAVPSGAGSRPAAGLAVDEGRQELEAMGVHVRVPRGALVVHR